MTPYFAIMAGIGQIAVCIILSYPVTWVVERASTPFRWLLDQQAKWAEFNRQYDESRRHTQ